MILTYFGVSLFLVSLCMVVSSVRDASHIPVPHRFPPHPRLFVNQREIEDLKTWAGRESWLGSYIDNFVTKCTGEIDQADRLTTNPQRAERAHHLAIAYVLSGERTLAAKSADILRSYIDLYPTYPTTLTKGRACSSTLDEATWAIDFASAYDLIYNSGALTDSDKHRIESNVLAPCGRVLRICNHRFRSNWRNRGMAGFGVIGFCIGDRELIEEALNGYRDDQGTLVRDGFSQHLATAILADGVNYERSIGYHYASMYNYTYLMEAARHCGVDLWHVEISGNDKDAGADVERRFGPTGPKTIKMIFDMPFYYVFGDASGARMSNAGDMRLERTWPYEAAWRQYRDPKYAWIIHQGADKKPKTPTELLWLAPDVPAGHWDLGDDARVGLTGRHERGCTLLPNGGYSILRQSAERDAVGLLMTYGKYGSGHSHPDNLSIVLYAAGRQVIPEVNYFKYGQPDFLTWNNQTIAHNTVTVDETAQQPQGTNESAWKSDTADKPVRGRPVFFYAGADLKAARAECQTAYDGVRLDRSVAMVDSIVVDVFRVRSDDQHQYDYVLHVGGELVDCSLPLSEQQGGPLSTSRGYSHIVDVRRAALSGEQADLVFDVTEGQPRLHLVFLPIWDGELIVAKGHADADGNRKAMTIVRAHAGNTDFVSVISFAEGLAAERIDGLPEGVIGIRIARTDGRQDIVISADEPRAFTFAGKKIAGQLALLSQSVDGAISVVETVA